MTILKAPGLILRPWRTEDKESLVKYANNRKVSINLRDRFPFPYTEQDADDWLQIASSGQVTTNFAIDVDSHAVGGIGLEIREDVHRCSAELGYWVAEPYWGKGLATKAVRLITDYGFNDLNLLRIFAGVFETNPASTRVLEKAGYIFESRQRKSVIKEGKVLDQLVYVKLRE